MKRRTLAFAGLAAIVSPWSSRAQERVRRVGFLSSNLRPPDSALVNHPLVRGLAENGYVVGRNLVIEWRFAAGQFDALPALVGELRERAEVIVVGGGIGAAAAAKGAPDRPLVIFSAGDPVGVGLVASLARPGGLITGVSEASTELSSKRLDLLAQLAPQAKRVAVLWNANDQGMTLRYRAFSDAARTLGLTIDAYALRSVADIDSALAAMAAQPPDALMVVSDALTSINSRRIVEFAAERKLPAMSEFADFVRVGGMIAYGPSLAEQIQRAAWYVARILGGARPGDLPMEEPTRFHLTLNAKAAHALGIEIPAALLVGADEVIE
jgi:putative ABC transport system substrate-binding protein